VMRSPDYFPEEFEGKIKPLLAGSSKWSGRHSGQ